MFENSVLTFWKVDDWSKCFCPYLLPSLSSRKFRLACWSCEKKWASQKFARARIFLCGKKVNNKRLVESFIWKATFYSQACQDRDPVIHLPTVILLLTGAMFEEIWHLNPLDTVSIFLEFPVEWIPDWDHPISDLHHDLIRLSEHLDLIQDLDQDRCPPSAQAV